MSKTKNMRINITNINSLAPSDHQYRIFDDKLKGFGVSVNQKSISYIVQYRNKYGQQKFLTIGKINKISPDEARKIAQKIFADIINGKDPATDRKDDKNIMTVGELCDWYLENCTKHKRESTIAHNNSSIERHIKPLIGNHLIKTITREDIVAMVRDIECGDKIRRNEKSQKPRGRIYVKGGLSAASHTLRLTKAIFNQAMLYEKIEHNPAQGIKCRPDNKRETFLTIDEIRDFGRLLAHDTVRENYKHTVNAVKLLLLTGCRRDEILSLRWEYINWEKQFFAFPITKTTNKQIRPFGKGALELLKILYDKRDTSSPFVFPSCRTSKKGHFTGTGLYKGLNTMMNIRDESGKIIFSKDKLTPHIFRHTFISMGEYLEQRALCISVLAGHKTNSAGITGQYIHIVDKSLIQAADTISLEIMNALNNSTGTGNEKELV